MTFIGLYEADADPVCGHVGNGVVRSRPTLRTDHGRFQLSEDYAVCVCLICHGPFPEEKFETVMDHFTMSQFNAWDNGEDVPYDFEYIGENNE